MTDLERVEKRIRALKAELADLEIAARVIRALSAEGDDGASGDSRHSPAKGSQKSNRITIVDAATTILKERGEQHYSAVAKEALSRGYEGKKGTSEEAIAKSFWATMKRKPEIFDAVGGGKFRLRSGKAQ